MLFPSNIDFSMGIGFEARKNGKSRDKGKRFEIFERSTRIAKTFLDSDHYSDHSTVG